MKQSERLRHMPEKYKKIPGMGNIIQKYAEASGPTPNTRTLTPGNASACAGRGEIQQKPSPTSVTEYGGLKKASGSVRGGEPTHPEKNAAVKIQHRTRTGITPCEKKDWDKVKYGQCALRTLVEQAAVAGERNSVSQAR